VQRLRKYSASSLRSPRPYRSLLQLAVGGDGEICGDDDDDDDDDDIVYYSICDDAWLSLLQLAV
jgi:hypothetical protein